MMQKTNVYGGQWITAHNIVR